MSAPQAHRRSERRASALQRMEARAARQFPTSPCLSSQERSSREDDQLLASLRLRYSSFTRFPWRSIIGTISLRRLGKRNPTVAR